MTHSYKEERSYDNISGDICCHENLIWFTKSEVFWKLIFDRTLSNGHQLNMIEIIIFHQTIQAYIMVFKWIKTISMIWFYEKNLKKQKSRIELYVSDWYVLINNYKNVKMFQSIPIKFSVRYWTKI